MAKIIQHGDTVFVLVPSISKENTVHIRKGPVFQISSPEDNVKNITYGVRGCGGHQQVWKDIDSLKESEPYKKFLEAGWTIVEPQ